MEVTAVHISRPRRWRVYDATQAWARGHALNRPSARTTWSHVWPWIVVSAMFASVGAWEGVLASTAIGVTILVLAVSRRPPNMAGVQHPRRRR